MGRTGAFFAADQEGVRPDMVAIAKGLGAGYQPIGALLVSEAVYDAVAAGSGFFQHGHTYMGHPAACAGGLAVLDAIEDRGLLANVIARGGELRQRLQARFGNHPHVGDVRGRGLLLGLELVADRGTKQPFDPGLRLAARIKAAGMTEGIMCYTMPGTVDGASGDHAMLAPPFIVDGGEVEEIVERLDRALRTALAGANAP
jgi:adenosylmethionine-8-amino-7-oxononanoate aminotransferase